MPREHFEKQLQLAVEMKREILEYGGEESWAHAVPSQREWALAHENMGDLELADCRLAQARRHYEKAYEVRKSIAEGTSTNVWMQYDCAGILIRMGDLSFAEGAYAEARKYFSEALSVFSQVAHENPDHSPSQRNWATALERIAKICQREGNRSEGDQCLTKSLDIRSALAETLPGNATVQEELVNCYRMLAMLYENLPQARSWLEKARAHLKDLNARGLLAPVMISYIKRLDAGLGGEKP